MKNKFLQFMGMAAMLMFGFNAQAQCLNVNGNMETFTAPVTSGNPWINDDLTNWNVSHGTPTVGTSPTTNIWMWSYNGLGEGIYTGFSFVAGETYELCYDVWRDGTSNPASVVRVELTNGLTPSAGGFGIPTPASQSLTTQPWTGTGTWVTVTETFTAASNYSQLWFYPFLAGAPVPWQAACRIDNVCIKSVVTDPCDFKPEFKVSYPDDCTTSFLNTTSVPSGLTVLGVTWDFGDGTTGSGNSVDHFYSTGGVYVVCMTVWVINEDGECCQLRECYEVEAKGCDPCDYIEKIKITATGSNPFTFTADGLPVGLYNVLGYHWDFGDGNQGTGYSVNHTYAAGGSYEVCLTVYYYNAKLGKCCSARVCIKVEAKDVKIVEGKAPVKLEEGVNYDKENGINTAENVVVAPNPNNGNFNVFTNDGTVINTITVYDASGKAVYRANNVDATSRMDVNISAIQKGLYVIILNENDDMNRQFSKLTIQ